MRDMGRTSNFLKAINKYAAEQRRELKNQTEEFKKKELQKAEAEVLRDAYYLIQKEMAQMRKGISSEASKEEMQGRKELFAQRKTIVEEVFRRCEKRLLEFANTSAYEELMKKYASKVSKVLKKPGTVLYVQEKDMEMREELKKSFGKLCKVLVSEEIKIGGLIAVNRNMNMIIDETLDSKLTDQREWFAENSKLNVF